MDENTQGTQDAQDTQVAPIKDRDEKEKTRILTVRLGQKEIDMVDTLKSSPYFINMSEFVRESIRHYYDKRVNKAGRVVNKDS